MNLKLKFSQNLYPSQIPKACISKSQSGPEFGTGTGIKKLENYYRESISNFTLDSRSEH